MVAIEIMEKHDQNILYMLLYILHKILYLFYLYLYALYVHVT